MDFERLQEALSTLEKKEKENQTRAPKSLVLVEFASGVTLTYFCDIPQIKEGDLVTVEGKKEDEIAIVKQVKTAFKKPSFDMKWIESVIDTDISGTYFKFGEDVLSFDQTLTAEKFITMFAGEKYEPNPAVGEDCLSLNLTELETSDLFPNTIVKLKGQDLYESGRVAFISLNKGEGKALVRGSKWYEIDFRCARGKITYLACDCPYFSECKHLYAFLLKLRDFSKKYYEKYQSDSFVLCKKECFSTILAYAKGKIDLKL